MNKVATKNKKEKATSNMIGKGDESKLKNNSFSEGIASVNEAINSNETLNSAEEFDKFCKFLKT